MNVLFITHDFTKTGAPILLLRVIKAIKKINPFCAISFACIYERGELKKDYLDVCDSYLGSVQKLTFVRKRVIRNHKFKHIFLNTIVAGEVVKQLHEFNIPIFAWLHEMPHTIEQYGLNLLDELLLYTSKLFVVDFITEAFIKQVAYDKGISASIQILRGCIDLQQKMTNTTQIVTEKFTFEHPLKLVSMGAAIWRKGIYDIPKVLDTIRDLPVSLDWYGAEEKHKGMREVCYTLSQMGLLNRFNIKGFTHDVPQVFKDYHIFLAISNEEPGPLTILESASVGIPTICWNSSIGLSDFSADNSGWVVPYQDYSILRETIQKILENPFVKQSFGRNAQKKAMQEYSPENRAKELLTFFTE